MSRLQTTFKENVIDPDTSTMLFEYLKNNIKWEEGVRSKKGFTRWAKPISVEECITQYPEIWTVIQINIKNFALENHWMLGIYLNYYSDGEMWTPNHSHPGMHQLVISLGGKRTLLVGKKKYEMGNGSVIIFGSSVHGVPKEETNDGRISIAVFLAPLKI